MNRRIHNLTESKLNRIINESVRNVLNEASTWVNGQQNMGNNGAAMNQGSQYNGTAGQAGSVGDPSWAAMDQDKQYEREMLGKTIGSIGNLAQQYMQGNDSVLGNLFWSCQSFLQEYNNLQKWQYGGRSLMRW